MKILFKEQDYKIQSDLILRLTRDFGWLGDVRKGLTIQQAIDYSPDVYFNFEQHKNGIEIYFKP